MSDAVAKHTPRGCLSGEELSVTKDPGKYVGRHRRAVQRFGLSFDEDDFEELAASFAQIERAERGL